MTKSSFGIMFQELRCLHGLTQRKVNYTYLWSRVELGIVPAPTDQELHSVCLQCGYDLSAEAFKALNAAAHESNSQIEVKQRECQGWLSNIGDPDWADSCYQEMLLPKKDQSPLLC